MDPAIPPLFHSRLEPVERSKEGSATRKAAYATGSRLRDIRLDTIHDYRRKPHVEPLPVTLPAHVDPDTWTHRGDFWAAVELAHTRRDAVPARTLSLSLNSEFAKDAATERRLGIAIQTWLASQFSVGVDGGIHRLPGNHHLDLVLTSKRIEANGKFGRKAEALDPIAAGKKMRMAPAADRIRAEWERLQNEALAGRGSSTRLDRRSYAQQGNGIVPGVHLGTQVSGMERRRPHSSHRVEYYLEMQSIREQSIREASWREQELARLHEEIRRLDPNWRIKDAVGKLGDQIQQVYLDLAQLSVPLKMHYRPVDLLDPVEPTLVFAEVNEPGFGLKRTCHFFRTLAIDDEAFLVAMERLERDYDGMKSMQPGWWPRFPVEEQFRRAYGLLHSGDDLEGMVADAWGQALVLAKADLGNAEEVLLRNQQRILTNLGPKPRPKPTILMIHEKHGPTTEELVAGPSTQPRRSHDRGYLLTREQHIQRGGHRR